MDQIESLELKAEVASKGIVTYVGDGIARVRLNRVMASELLEFQGLRHGLKPGRKRAWVQ